MVFLSIIILPILIHYFTDLLIVIIHSGANNSPNCSEMHKNGFKNFLQSLWLKCRILIIATEIVPLRYSKNNIPVFNSIRTDCRNDSSVDDGFFQCLCYPAPEAFSLIEIGVM